MQGAEEGRSFVFCFVNLKHQMVCYSEPSEKSRLNGDQQGGSAGTGCLCRDWFGRGAQTGPHRPNQGCGQQVRTRECHLLDKQTGPVTDREDSCSTVPGGPKPGSSSTL